MRQKIHSDTVTGFDARRPPGIVTSPAWWAFSSYLSERMSVALSGLDVASDPRLCRLRLLHFWLNTSSQITADGLADHLVYALNDLPAARYAAAGCWLDGSWHHDRGAMMELLWRIGASPSVVGAGEWLHRIGNRHSSDNLVFY